MIDMEDRLLDLYARLSRGAERSRLYAMRARKDGRPTLARLFLALADSQDMQAKRFLMQVRGSVSTTDENEQNTFRDELPAAIDAYEKLLREAEKLGNRALATGFTHSAAIDRRTLELHDTLDQRAEATEYFVCDFCGYLVVDEPPDNCPVCTAPKNRFRKVASQ